jgi:hypothetical protein
MVVWIVKNFSTFYRNLNVSYRLLKNRTLVPNLSQMYPDLAPPHLTSLKLLSYPLTSFQVDSPFMINNQNFVCISHLVQMWPLYPSLTLFPLRHNSYIIILSKVYVYVFIKFFQSQEHVWCYNFTRLKVQDLVLLWRSCTRYESTSYKCNYSLIRS